MESTEDETRAIDQKKMLGNGRFFHSNIWPYGTRCDKGKEDISASTLKFFRGPRSNTQKAQDSLRVLSLVRNYVLVSILGPEEGHFDVLETKFMSTVKTSRSELG